MRLRAGGSLPGGQCLPDGDWKSVLTKSLGRNGVLEFTEMGLEILFGAETFAFSWVDFVGLFLTG